MNPNVLPTPCVLCTCRLPADLLHGCPYQRQAQSFALDRQLLAAYVFVEDAFLQPLG